MKFRESHLTEYSRLLRLTAAALFLAAGVGSTQAGALADLYYGYTSGIAGNAVTNLTQDPTFPTSPDFYDAMTSGLSSPVNVADNYGRLIRGYFEAPQSGQYTFWIASDDDSELWLSTNYDAANKVKIAENIGAVYAHNYFAKAAQQSAPVSLTAGEKYYFEVLHKEGGGADFVMVQWQLPDGTVEDPIGSKHIWPFPIDQTNPLAFSATPLNEAPAILNSYLGSPVDSLAPTTVVPDGGSADLTITADGTQPAYVQWYVNGTPIPNANLLSYHLPQGSVSLNGAVYSVTVTNANGSATASTTLSVTADTTPLTLVDALSLGNATGDIAVVFSKSVDPATATLTANYSLSGGAHVASARIGKTLDTVLLQTLGMTVGNAYIVTVSNVRDLASTPNTIAPASAAAVDQYLNTWYRLDESSGTTAVDSSGNGRNGAMQNDVIPGYTGKVLRALKFAGVTGGDVRFPNGFEDFSTNGLTISLWSYPTIEGAQANWDRFTDFGNTNNADNVLFSRNAAGPSVHFEVYKGATSSGSVNTYDGSLLINQWQHFAATLDASGNVVIYRNGVPIASGTTGVPNVLTRTSNFLGRSNWSGDDYYTGKMDDVRVYNRVLTPAAVAALANGGGADDVDPTVPSVSVAATVPSTALKNTPPGVFTLTRSGDTNVALTVSYALSGTATNGLNYTNLNGSAVIPAGTNSVAIYVTPIDFSFQGSQVSVVLTVLGSPNYTVANADSGTVAIQNNDVSPAAIEATADNTLGTLPTTVDVWFASVVATPSATTLANYTLINAPGVSITNAVLTSRNLRVVLGLSAPIPTGAQLAVSGVQDPGGNSSPSQIPIRLGLGNAANVVANVYHGATTSRAQAFTWMTDGIVNNVNNAGSGFDTFDNAASLAPFGGMLYLTAEDIQVIKVDLGQQFSDGGSWLAQPFVYLLTNAVDSGSVRPDLNTNWTKVNALLISGSQFQSSVDPNPSPNTPIVFDLTGLPASQRLAYGWAVGGVNGNGAKHFLSFTELRAYGAPQSAPALVFTAQPTNITVTAGQTTKFNAVVDSVLPINFQWLKNAAPLANGTLSVTFPNPSFVTESAVVLPPVTSADNGAQLTLSVNNAAGNITSQTATLTVLPRTTPPVVLDATYDPSNVVVEVWFDGSIDPGTALNTANYTLSDPSVSFSGAIQDAQGFHVTLSLSGPPSPSNLTLRVANIMDFSGNTLSSQTVSVLPLSTRAIGLVADAYQQGYATAFSRSTDGMVTYDANVTTWTTFGSVPTGLVPNSQFVGLEYAQPWAFGLLRVDLGYQFGDGGDWAAQPRVFILRNPVYTAQTPPENDPADWVEVPAVLTSGSRFDIMPDAPANTIPPPNTPIAFDLSQLPLSQRTGYGWAIGGVPGNGPNAHFVSLAELRAYGLPITSLTNGAGAPQIVLDLPSTLTVSEDATLSTFMGATGAQPLHYQWLHNGVILADNGRVTGSQTGALNIANAGLSDAGSYQVIVTNSLGSVTSAVETISIVASALNNGAGWILNSASTNVPIANNAVLLTDGGGGEARSAFLSSPKYIRAFHANWVYQDIGGGGADGVCFVLQNDPRGASALGGGGGQLGYGGITPSAALEFNIYSGNAPSATSSGIAFQNNGLTGKPYADASPVNPASGNLISVDLLYDGTTAFVTLSNSATAAVFNTNYVADLPTILGTNTAFVGFTGASGGVASKQQVSNFSFVSLFPEVSAQLTGTNTVLLSWAASGGALALQHAADLANPNWDTVAALITQVGPQNQVVVPLQGKSGFYRIRLQ